MRTEISARASLVAVVLTGFCCGCGGTAEKGGPVPAATTGNSAPTDPDSELKQFATEVVPGLQQAIDRYDQQVTRSVEQRATFARDMSRLGINPDTRAEYVKKGELIAKMRNDLERLLASRKETYIRWKELKLLGDSAETKKQLDDLLLKAGDAAKAAEERFKKETE